MSITSELTQEVLQLQRENEQLRKLIKQVAGSLEMTEEVPIYNLRNIINDVRIGIDKFMEGLDND